MNIDGIRTIGSVLGQSIALDYYVRQVGVYKLICDQPEKVLICSNFLTGILCHSRLTEWLLSLQTSIVEWKRLELSQWRGKSFSNWLARQILILLMLFLSQDFLKDPILHGRMRNMLKFGNISEIDFELTQRFASLDFKLKFVEHNIRYLQEILQNRKLAFLEWLIIILIGAEIHIQVYDIAHKSSIALQVQLLKCWKFEISHCTLVVAWSCCTYEILK